MRKVGTLTSALTLLVLGLALLIDIAAQKPIMSVVLRFWPIAILGISLELLWSLYTIKKQKTNEEIRVDARSIALLCLVGVFSTALYTAQNVEGMVQNSILNVRDAFTDKTVDLAESKFDSKDIQKLEVYSRLGNIKATKSDSPSVSIKTKVHVRNLNSQQANEEAQNWTPRVTQGSTTRVEVDPSMSVNSKITSVDLEIQVPANMSLQILGNEGNITVEDHRGDLVVSTETGKIEVARIKGKTTLENNDGQVLAKGVDGELEVKAKKGRIEVDHVTGNTNLRTTYGQIRAVEIGGALRMACDEGDIQLDKVAGEVNAQTQKGLIQASNMKKAVNLTSGAGGITVESEVQGSWILNSTRGMVSLRVPANSNLEFIGESAKGLVKGPTKSDSTPNGSRVSEKMGQGTYSVLVRSEDGAITLNANL